ncbi:MAG: hypothetical protein K0R15_229 [Clostridiales bacterium]|jgi:HD-GYP domain-containing protein (c-di-GMP phosphodiesterase class II)|nr:hypothetical protein [Clostridiales bacterium]
MKQKYKLIIILILFTVLITAITNYNLKDSSIIKISNVVDGAKAKRTISSTPTLKVKLLGENSNLLYKKQNKYNGIYELVRKSLNASLNLDTEVIEANSSTPADLFFGPEAIFDKSYFFVSKPIYTKQYILYTTDFSKNKLEDFKNDKLAYCGFSISDGYLEDNIVNVIKESAFDEYNLVNFSSEERATSSLHNGYYLGLISDQEIVELDTNSNIKKIVIDKVIIDFVIAYRMRELNPVVGESIVKFTKKLTNHRNYYSLVMNETYEYYKESFKNTLTVEEEEWILKNRNILYSVPDDYAPYSDSDGDELTGITINVMDSLSKVTGINFAVQDSDINQGSTQENGLVNELSGGRVKVLPFIGKYNSKELKILYTKPIYEADVVVIGNHKGLNVDNIQDLENMTIVVTRDNFIVDEVEKNTTNVKFIYAKSNEEIFEILDHNPNYISVLDLLVLNTYIKKSGEQDVKVVGKIAEQEYFIAVAPGNEMLVTILDRAIDLIDVERFAYNYTVTSSSPMNFSKWSLPMFVLFCLILLTLLYLQKVLKDLKSSKLVKDDIQKMNVEYDHIIGQVLEIFETASLVTQTNTYSHTKRLMTYCEILAMEYGLGKEFAWEISHYVPIHDIGNIGVNNDLFTKTEKLTEEEYEQLKMHVKVGTDLVVKMKFDDVAKNIVQYHHERWDGLGYFEQLKGTKIPIEARIVHLADTYDILRMERPYKRAFTHEEALYTIVDERGKQFEPRLVDIFVKYNTIFESCFDTSIELMKKLK